MRLRLDFNNEKPNLAGMEHAWMKGMDFAHRLGSSQSMNYSAEFTSVIAKKNIYGARTVDRIQRTKGSRNEVSTPN